MEASRTLLEDLPAALPVSSLLCALATCGSGSADAEEIEPEMAGAYEARSWRTECRVSSAAWRKGVFDLEDLQHRTEELARFLEAARVQYGFREDRVVAVGYSNGANIAASLLLRFQRLLRAAVLFRAMVPFTPETPPDLAGVQILMTAGLKDSIVPITNTRQLAAIFESAGANVSTHWHEGGHELGLDDVEATKLWLAGQSLSPEPQRTT
jgi:predicted esterase